MSKSDMGERRIGMDQYFERLLPRSTTDDIEAANKQKEKVLHNWANLAEVSYNFLHMTRSKNGLLVRGLRLVLSAFRLP